MNDFKVHYHASEGAGSVSSFAIETDSSLILIDAQRQRREARRFLDRLSSLNKPIAGLLLTHGHPDHIGGAQEILDRAEQGLPVYATATTVAEIDLDEGGFIKLASQILGADFTNPSVAPSHVVRGGDEISLGGVRILVHELGPGEASSMTAYELRDPNVLFCGDLVANGMTPFLFEGKSGQWTDQLAQFPSQFNHINTLYCGHGKPGPAKELIERQLAYIQTFRDRVRAALKQDGLSKEQVEAIRIATENDYPGFLPVAEIPDFIEGNIYAVAKELS